MPWDINSAASAVSALPLKRWCSSYSGSATWSMTSAPLPRRTFRSLWRWFTSKTCCSMSKCLHASAVRGVGAPSRSTMVPMGCASAQELFHLLLALCTSCFPMYKTKVMLSSQGPLKTGLFTKGYMWPWTGMKWVEFGSGCLFGPLANTVSVSAVSRGISQCLCACWAQRHHSWPQYLVKDDS